MKKIICIVLSALLLLPFLCFKVYAEDNVDVTLFTREEWYSLTVENRDLYFNYAIQNNGGELPSFSITGRLGKSLSYEYYNGLLTGDRNAMLSLQLNGLVNFNLKVGNEDGHDGGGFGGHRNDIDKAFDEFQQDYPYSGISSGTAYQFENGYYITWEPLYSSAGGMNFSVNGETHRKSWYKIRFYLHDTTGKIIDMYTHSYAPSCACDTCEQEPFVNFTITQDGYFYYDFYNSQNKHLADLETSNKYELPWYKTYGPVQDTDPPVVSIPVTLTDDDGNTINAVKEGDYITYEGSTYNYNNSDNSVNIGGNTYYYTYDYGSMGDTYMQDFYDYLTNTYITNNYGTTINFDDSNILNALNSIYNKLHSILSRVATGFSSVGNKLDEIIKQLKSLNKEVAEITEEEEEKNALAWLDLINDFKKKVGWSALEKSVENIKTAFFGDRTFTETEDGGVDVTIVTEEQGVINSSLPYLYITVNGQQYSLYGCLGSLGDGIATIKLFISSFLWIGFIVAVFRSIPAILGGVASVSDQSNSVVIDKHTGEVKRGG